MAMGTLSSHASALVARRAWLQCGAHYGLRAMLMLGAGALPSTARAHEAIGPLTPPRPALPLPLLLHDGRATSLPALLQGRVTAVQLMFTGCAAACPIQGAVFAEVQRLVAAAPLPRAQLLSVSIDPLSDDAAALAAWRRRFGAAGDSPAVWWAAAPPLPHAEALPRFVGDAAGALTNGDRHSTRVHLFDPLGRLAFRMAEFASPRSIVETMAQLARRGA